MKILIVSDTHRKDDNLKRVLEEVKPIDMFIHLGDAEGSEQFIPEWLNPECEVQMIRGNNDFFSDLDKEREIRIGGYQVLLTHGHYYNVSLGTETIKREAAERKVDMVMFGHTHRPCYEIKDDLVVLNPGSLSFPRQEGRKPSYMIMELDEKGRVHVDLRYVGSEW